MPVQMTGTAVKDILITIRNAIIPLLLVLQAIIMPAPARANDYLQCVPFARELSGIRIYGDAHSWWDQAEGNYQRGALPAIGAVLSLPSHGSMRLGHVAVVREIVDDRTILISHANWSPINGRRGQIERRVKAKDVSRSNDWSKVRIWYAPIGKLGTTAFPVNGFIYPVKPGQQVERQWASSNPPRSSGQTSRPLFDRSLKADLARTADEERPAETRPRDLIGELLDRVGS